MLSGQVLLTPLHITTTAQMVTRRRLLLITSLVARRSLCQRQPKPAIHLAIGIQIPDLLLQLVSLVLAIHQLRVRPFMQHGVQRLRLMPMVVPALITPKWLEWRRT